MQDQIESALDAYRTERDAAAKMPDGGPAKVILAGQALANALQSLLDQPDIPDELLTFEQRVARIRERLLLDLDQYTAGDDSLDDADDVAQLKDEVAMLEMLDRVLHRRERRAELLPATLNTQVVNAPSDGELRVAIWHAMEDIGATAQAADQVTLNVLQRLGYEPENGHSPAHARPEADQVDADNDSGASG